MSLSSVILFAFIIVCVFWYKTGYEFIYNFLRKRRNSTCEEIEISLNVERDSLSFLNLVLLKSKSIEIEVKKIIESANSEADLIIKKKEQQIEKMLDSYQDLILFKVESKISEATQRLISDSVIVAAKATEKLIQEYVSDETNNSKIISSLSHDLNKKLH